MEAQGLPESSLVQEIGRPLYDARNWLKFIGITQIVFIAIWVIGVLVFLAFGVSTLSDYTGSDAGYAFAPLLVSLIPFGLAIWQSVLLVQAGSSAQAAYLNGDKAAMYKALANLKTYFIIIGVLLLIGIVLFVLSICATIGLTIAGASILNDLRGSGFGLP